MKLYRAMTPAVDGLPQVGPSARKLGVRNLGHAPNQDVDALDPSDIVTPGVGGMSVAPNDPINLDHRRRPPEIGGGKGKDPVWVIDEADLGTDLRYLQDDGNENHGVVEPSQPMTLVEFQESLASTRAKWQRYTVGGGDA